MRDHRNWFGFTKATLIDDSCGLTIEDPFIAITEVNLFDWSLHWVYKVWASVDAFDNELLDIGARFRREVRLEGQEFENFKTENSILLTEAESLFSGLCSPTPTGEAQLEIASINTIDYRINIAYNDVKTQPKPVCPASGDFYWDVFAQNVPLIGGEVVEGEFVPGLFPILHTVSATKFPDYFANRTLITPES